MKKVGMIVISAVCCLALTIMPTFALEGSTASVSNNFTLYQDNTGTLTFQIQCSSLKPRLETYSITYYDGNGNVTIKDKGNVAQDFIVMIRVANNTTSDLFINQGYMTFSATLASNPYTPNYVGSSVTSLSGNLADTITSVSTTGTIQLRWASAFTYNSGLVVPAKSVLYAQIIYTQYYYDTSVMGVSGIPSEYAYKVSAVNLVSPSSDKVSTITDFTLMNADYNSIEQVELLDSIYQELVLLYGMENQKLSNINMNILQLIQSNHTDLTQLHTDLQAILDAYTTNASNTQSTQSNITEVGSEESQLHQAELSYYQQNQQALQNVGISNFSFDSNQSSGLGAVVSDFTDLWTNIGPLQIIFTFTLSMSLATYLLRHKPITGAIKQNERKK